MSTTDYDPTPPPPPASGRVLRRSRTDRVGAGVAGGLGEYLGLDPVLFRVLFAVSAFFGGAGVLAYVLAWGLIPEQGTERAAVDGWIAELRRRNVRFWAVAVVAGIVLWCVAFSWWAPGPFFPVLVVIGILVVLFGRRGDQAGTPSDPPGTPSGPSPAPDEAHRGPVSLSKPAPAAAATGDAAPSAPSAPTAPSASTAAEPPRPTAPPDWVSSARAWLDESKRAGRERRRRAFPVRVGTLVTLVLTLIGLGIADAAGGIALPLYFWFAAAIVTAGLLTGMVLRRTPWSMAALLVPVVAGMIAFGNTRASLHDGIGDTGWAPASAADLHREYRLAFGRATLDLRDMSPAPTARRVDVIAAAGQVRVLLPSSLNASVHADVRIGDIDVNGRTVAGTQGGSVYRVDGYHARRTVGPPEGALGAPITIDVHLADGQIAITRSP